MKAAPSSRAGSRYVSLRSLASGGMASVELALQVSSGGFERLVAVKRIRSELAASEQMVAMFMEEARIAALLNHPNLIHAYELCEDDQGLFLAMEHLRGQPFSNVLELSGSTQLDLRFSLEVLIQTLEGLHHAHELPDIDGRHLGLVHRDISPSNVFVTYAGHVKVLDFGIAKTRASSIETEAGMVKGKAAYMAPEQAQEQPLDGRADVYSVGAMLWEVIANRPRWDDLPYPAVLAKLMQARKPEPPGAAERGLPLFFDRVTTRALAFDPDERFQSAAELKSALVVLADHLGSRPTPREMSDYVCQRFERQRSQEQRAIDNELAALRDHQDGSPRPTQTRSIGGGTRPLAIAAIDQPAARDESGECAVEANVAAGSGARLKVTPRAHGRVWQIALPAALLAGVVISWLSSSLKSELPHAAGPAQAVVESAQAPAAEPSAPATPEPPAAIPESSSSAVPAVLAKPALVKRPVRKHAGSKPKAKQGLELDRGSPW